MEFVGNDSFASVALVDGLVTMEAGLAWVGYNNSLWNDNNQIFRLGSHKDRKPEHCGLEATVTSASLSRRGSFSCGGRFSLLQETKLAGEESQKVARSPVSMYRPCCCKGTF